MIHATFGVADNSHTYIPRPATQQQLASDYFVAIYGGVAGSTSPGSRATKRVTASGRKEFLEYERTRLRSTGKQ